MSIVAEYCREVRETARFVLKIWSDFSVPDLIFAAAELAAVILFTGGVFAFAAAMGA